MPNVKELSKAVTAFLAAPSLPLPDELQTTIDTFIHKHKTHDDQCAETLHEELRSLYRKHVTTPDYVARMPPFFSIVSMLTDNLRSEERVKEWWEVGRTFITNVLKDPALVVESTSWMQAYLALGDRESDESPDDAHIAVNPLLDKLVDIWATDYHLGFVAGSQDLSEKSLRDAMMQYGKKNPKRFFVCVDRFLVRKETRKAALSLLIELVQAQPPRLHVIMQTNLFLDIMRCLQHDTSTSVVSSALTLLLMILPSIPNSLGPHLPMLFNIYARLLFWSRDRADLGGIEPDTPSGGTAPSGWDVHPPSSDDGQNIPRLINYFTVLYGLFPINFMEYIRKPQRYLRHFGTSRTDDVEVEATEIRQKSEPFRQCHIIHPNFYTTTIESEKTDFGRWQKSEPQDITAECMALCLATESGGETFGHAFGLDQETASFDGTLGLGELGREDAAIALLSGSMPAEGWRSTIPGSPALSQASAQMQPSLAPEAPSWPTSARESTQPSAVPSPFLLAQAGSPATKAQQLQDMIHHNRAIKLSLDQSLPNDSIPSLSLSHIESTATDTDKQTVGEGAHDPLQHVAHLQRQITLLQNDLRFERYLRQQHVAHIGTLRRKQLAELATEAEMQNLIMSNRNMKHRIEEAKKGEMQARRESEKSRAMSKKWENDTYSKMRAAKMEAQETKAEAERLRQELEQIKKECHDLKGIVCQAEARELTSRQHWQTAQDDLAKVEDLKKEVERLNAVLAARSSTTATNELITEPKSEEEDSSSAEPKLEEEDVSTTEPNIEDDLAPPTTAASASVQVESLRLELAARDHDMQQMRVSFEEQISQLKEQILQLVDGQKPRPDPAIADMRTMFETALAASRAKQAELQGQYDSLARKHTALQSELLDMRASAPPPSASTSVRVNSPAVSDYESSVPSPTGRGLSRARTFVDGDGSDGFTPPLDSRSAANSPTLSGVGGALQASASWGLDGGVPLEGRYSAKVTSQHTRRKDGKEKKSSGLRGLSRLGGSS